jgi:hypothetical protein
MQLQSVNLGYCQNVEVYPSNSAANLVWQFPDLPYLRDKYILSIQMKLSSNGITTSKTNLGINIIDSTYSSYSPYLTLVDIDGNQFIQNMPLNETNPIKVSTFSYNDNGLIIFSPKRIAWSKCFIKFATATGVSNACVAFSIYYKMP